MRIIALKLQDDTKKLLRNIAKNTTKRDIGFVEDLYCLFRLKGTGIPTPDRIKKMCELAAPKAKMPVMVLMFMANKRALLFNQIVKLSYFNALTKLGDEISVTERFLLYFTKLHNKVRQAVCMTCALRSNCDFGKQYGEIFVDIDQVIDPDYSKKAHPDCPELPEIERTNQIFTSINTFNQLVSNSGTMNSLADLPPELEELAEEQAENNLEDPDAEDDLENYLEEEDFDERDSPTTRAERTQGGRGNDTGGLGGRAITITEAMIDNLTSASLNIYELGRKLSLALGKNKKGKFSPTKKVDKSRKQRKMKSESEITKIVPSQHALPDEIFKAKKDRKDLAVKQNMKPELENKLLYLLIDNSWSMSGQLPGATHLMCSRGTLASTLGIALVRHVKREKGIVFLRYFASAVSSLHEASTEEAFKEVELVLATASNLGSGTDIVVALTSAKKDIDNGKAGKLNIGEAELLLITDCEDKRATSAGIIKAMGEQKYSVLDVSGGQFPVSSLKRTAEKYYKANEGELDINKLVSLV